MNGIKQALKEYEKVLNERDRYKRTIGKYLDIANEAESIKKDLLILSTRLDNIAKGLDPMRTINNRVTKNTNMKSYINEVYDKMKTGTQITMPLLEGLYPNLEEKKQRYIITRLKTYPSVKTRKAGKQVRLYYFTTSGIDVEEGV